MATPPSAGTDTAPELLVERVLVHFGIATTSLESISPLVSGSGRHHGFRVRADGISWALKRHSSPAALERLARSQSLELRLADAGFPVAPMWRSTAGETSVREGTDRYSLHEWVEGRQVSVVRRDAVIEKNPGFVGEMARLVAELHLISSEHPDTAALADPDRILRAPRTNLRQIRRPGRRLLPAWQLLRAKPGKSDFDRWIVRTLPGVGTRAEALARRSIAARVGPSDVGLIHNDLNWENLVFDDEFRVRALLDFDNAASAPWVLEVGAGAVVLVGPDPSRVEEFVTAYEETRGESLDREQVDLAMELKCVRSIMTSVVSYLEGQVDGHLLEPWCVDLHASLQRLGRG